MDKEKSLQIVAEGLACHGAAVYEYEGTRFVAIKNADGRSHLAIVFGEECVAMEFATQTARFEYGNEGDLIAHVEKYLTDELCAVEFFMGDQALFGGSRDTSSADFSSARTISEWYAAGNKEIADGIEAFLKKNSIIVRSFSWSGKADRCVRTLEDGSVEDVK